MFCNNFKNMGILFLYNELNKAEKQLFQEHLTYCDNCRSELKVLKETVKIYQTLPDEEISPLILQDIKDSFKIRNKYPFSQKFRKLLQYLTPNFEPRWRLSLVPAGIIILILALFMVENVNIHQHNQIDQNLIMAWNTEIDDSLQVINEDVLSFQEQSQPSSIIEDQILALWVSSTDRKLSEIRKDIEYLSREINKSYF